MSGELAGGPRGKGCGLIILNACMTLWPWQVKAKKPTKPHSHAISTPSLKTLKGGGHSSLSVYNYRGEPPFLFFNDLWYFLSHFPVLLQPLSQLLSELWSLFFLYRSRAELKVIFLLVSSRLDCMELVISVCIVWKIGNRQLIISDMHNNNTMHVPACTCMLGVCPCHYYFFALA